MRKANLYASLWINIGGDPEDVTQLGRGWRVTRWNC
jgi:hypothetical protein